MLDPRHLLGSGSLAREEVLAYLSLCCRCYCWIRVGAKKLRVDFLACERICLVGYVVFDVFLHYATMNR